ncbi:MAG: SDR family NAD(P)-dependent oxidoreductase [Balneolaceae bacterium]
MKNLSGSSAILTGASRGIGIHIARALARQGINLALVARSTGALDKVSDDVQSFDVKTAVIPADLSETRQVEDLAKKAEKELGPVDILINNAGVEFTAPFEEYPAGELETEVQVNLLAPMLLTRFVLPGMLKRKHGHIVNISSLAGKTGLPFQTPYGSTKAGLVMFSHSLRAELLNNPVGVSVICPGFVADDGMYARVEKNGLRAPKLMKPSAIDSVTTAVIRAIKKDVAEIIVNPLPMRPGVVLRELFPGITPYLHKFTGTAEFSRKVSLLPAKP